MSNVISHSIALVLLVSYTMFNLSSLFQFVVFHLTRIHHGLEISCLVQNPMFPDLRLSKSFTANITCKDISLYIQ